MDGNETIYTGHRSQTYRDSWFIRFYPRATSSIIMIKNPAMTPIVPAWECFPIFASGINSSTTTYIIAPAAKDKSQGIMGAIHTARSTAIKPKTGSTMPDIDPIKKALPVETPS